MVKFNFKILLKGNIDKPYVVSQTPTSCEVVGLQL